MVQVETLACTNDINPWGESGSCTCPEATSYNEKIGQCLVGEPYPIMVSGVLQSKNALTRGVSLKTDYGTFQLVVKTDDLAKLQKANGLYFEATGEFILMPAVRPSGRPTIIVESLVYLE